MPESRHTPRINVTLDERTLELADLIAAHLGTPDARGRSQAIRFAIGMAAESLGLLRHEKRSKRKT